VSNSIVDFVVVGLVVTRMDHQIEAINLHLEEEAQAFLKALIKITSSKG
jgi:hypothetical protein